MEGGSAFLEYVTYGMIAVVLFALGFLALRTAKFFLTLLAIPLLEAASRWAPSARVVARWGERGGRRDPTSWRATLQPTDATATVTRGTAPPAVRRGLTLGALVGAMPGVWSAITGVSHARDAGASAGEVAATIGIAIGLVAAAGALLGGAVGAMVGLLADAVAEGRRR